MDILSYIGGVLTGGIGLKIIEKFIDFKTGEVADNRKQKKLSRYELSTEVLKILTEGGTKKWEKKPNDMNHINFIARQVELEDPEVDKKFTKLISDWNICAARSSTIMVGAFTRGEGFSPEKLAQFAESEKFVNELQKELTQLDKEITVDLRKWRR